MTFLSENSTQITIHAASSNSDQACEITADSAVEITAKALAYIFIFMVTFFLVSIGSLLLISIDRLFAVVSPLKAKLISSKVRLISILITWCVAIVFHAPYFYSFKLILYENKTYCILNWGPALDHLKTHNGYVTASFITFILIPVIILVIVYGIIAWTIRKKNKKSKERLSCRQNHRDQQLRKIVQMTMAIMISFVTCMTPLLIYLFLLIFLWNWKSPPVCAFQTIIPFISVFLLHSWSAVNPCICFIFSKNYRNGLRQCFHCDGLSRRLSSLRENYRMRTMTSSYGDSSLQIHSSSVHIISYSRNTWARYIFRS